ncbi:DUF4124 domain-containing protein [Sansalvadorimonas verongulae]|uniref:DUF4124 domain-containing protein n=1 Tax=Sansalvadorimonas verongulae TaxID=2172824 RepID=UPI0012BB58DD|nr:DUF4124 domain-containing protein [Sansalvadorimonas verongulae]MTI12852.1 DUF4124 domain-containing protein [Sansalvadorimonas verongulae]
MKTATALLLAAVVSAGFSFAAHATIYKWTDSDGTVHFGKQPPPQGTEFSEIKSPRNKAPLQAESPASTKPASESTVQEDMDKYNEQLNRLAEQQREACNRATENKERLLNNHRIQMRDENGNVRTLTYEEKLQQLQRADEGIQEYCVN